MTDLGVGPVKINPPEGPTFTAPPPAVPTMLVVPVAGPVGPEADAPPVDLTITFENALA